jgi:hypothetical protein
VAPAISSAEKPLPAAVAEGGAESGSGAARVREPGTRQLRAPRTANALPPITEGRSGPLPAQRPTPTRRTPLPALMMNILEAEGGAEAAPRLASPSWVTTGEGIRPGCLMKILEAERWLKGTNFHEIVFLQRQGGRIAGVPHPRARKVERRDA